jgi:hypothetical protein
MEAIKLFEGEIPETVSRTDVEETRKDITDLINRANSVTITDIQTCQNAETFSAECKRREKVVDEKFKESLDSATETKRKATVSLSKLKELIDSLKGGIEQARRILDGKAGKWRRDEQERLRIEAEKKAVEERKRIEDERLAAAAELEKAGTAESKRMAERILDEPIIVETTPAPVLPKAQGVSYQPKWEARLVSMKELVKAAAADDRYMVFLSFNQVAANSSARLAKMAFSVPGVEAVDAGKAVHK